MRPLRQVDPPCCMHPPCKHQLWQINQHVWLRPPWLIHRISITHFGFAHPARCAHRVILTHRGRCDHYIRLTHLAACTHHASTNYDKLVNMYGCAHHGWPTAIASRTSDLPTLLDGEYMYPLCTHYITSTHLKLYPPCTHYNTSTHLKLYPPCTHYDSFTSVYES